ncbi:MAG: 30S ribosomal protein S16 [Phycisphaerales bacterium]
MVRIRMQRSGRKNRPFYRIQVIDGRVRRDGAAIEQLGWYDPVARDQAKQLNLNEERAKYWIGVGAQPSGTVRDIFAKRNLIETKAWEAERTHRREVVKAKAAAAAVPAEGAKKAEGEKKEEKAEEAKA